MNLIIKLLLILVIIKEHSIEGDDNITEITPTTSVPVVSTTLKPNNDLAGYIIIAAILG